MPRIRTPWDRAAEVDRDAPSDVLPSMDSSDVTYIDQSATVPPDLPSAPKARFEARITKDGSVVIPSAMIGPVMSMIGAWWRDHHPEHPAAPESTRSQTALPPDAYIDQNDGRVPKRIYLRLAREEAFPTTRIGKKILAKWSDVEAALVVRRRKPRSRIESQATDDLDQIRRDMGLVPRGGR